jgi:hypothetical protein
MPEGRAERTVEAERRVERRALIGAEHSSTLEDVMAVPPARGQRGRQIRLVNVGRDMT